MGEEMKEPIMAEEQELWRGCHSLRHIWGYKKKC